MCFSLLFFFFKQKTAYEMRISDWSSDVCSSDLLVEEGRVADDGGADAADGPEARQCFVGHVEAPGEGERGADAARLRLPFRRAAEPRQQPLHARVVDGDQSANAEGDGGFGDGAKQLAGDAHAAATRCDREAADRKSTSELKTTMRISD